MLLGDYIVAVPPQMIPDVFNDRLQCYALVHARISCSILNKSSLSVTARIMPTSHEGRTTKIQLKTFSKAMTQGWVMLNRLSARWGAYLHRAGLASPCKPHGLLSSKVESYCNFEKDIEKHDRAGHWSPHDGNFGWCDVRMRSRFPSHPFSLFPCFCFCFAQHVFLYTYLFKAALKNQTERN